MYFKSQKGSPRFGEAGVAQVLVLVLLLGGILAGVYLVQRQTNLKPKASTFNVELVDEQNNPISVVTQPRARLKISAPYPPTPNISQSARVVMSPQELAKANSGNKNKKTIIVSGKLFDKETRARVGVGEKVCCDTQGVPVTVQPDGYFKFQAKVGDGFSLFSPIDLLGYEVPIAVNIRSYDAGKSAYQLQVAGIDCLVKNSGLCKNPGYKTHDLANDSSFDFAYIPIKSPAPSSQPSSTPSTSPAPSEPVSPTPSIVPTIAPSQSPAFTPLPEASRTPETIYTTNVLISTDPTFPLGHTIFIPYTSTPTYATYEFGARASNGTKVLYVRFYLINGNSINGLPFPLSFQMNLPTPSIVPTPIPSPSSMPTSTPTPTPTPTSAPTPTPFATEKRVFVTSTGYNGNLGGLVGADAKCQEEANSADLGPPLGGNWKAWLSDQTTSAGLRLLKFAGPYKLLNGVVVANNWLDLTDGLLQNPIKIQRWGYTANSDVWTGTLTDGSLASGGSASSNCNNWSVSSSASFGLIGVPRYTNYGWTQQASQQCHFILHLYCFEQ